ncbi:MAG: molecular chaperone DnaK [Oceanotoga sp.]|jgi:molecular chaperone DnaK (HSP70)|uniref:Hsp70 family protein n=1 Tax=Oceanotoga sp. TaxID=2108366 RepID=UPI00264E4F2A|nr:Hsp70 family protein [Oceanotoga sp.]MDN5343761.1 molecular chaperone DnaK [Oceanotoga sp.]
MKKEFFIGIDLGTTNSLLSWSKIDTNERIKTEILDTKMLDSTGSLIRNKKLPSTVYFGKDTPKVGQYAKNMVLTRPDLVVKSVKSFMGENKNFEFNNKSYYSSDIQAMILKQLAQSSKDLFGFIPENVIITVPASFDSDMRKETLDAAEKAGFSVKKGDGSYKNILLDEPRAVIFDFINKHNNGEIPESLIDFKDKKNILVFDLGGGTLDVSLHKVFYDKKIQIEDYAVSRYTKIGGDNFDELLAKELLIKFISAYEIDYESLNEVEKMSINKKFSQIAEEAKIELSDKIQSNKLMGIEDHNPEIEIIKGNIYDNYIFEYDLSLKEYKKIISPLLKEEFKFDDFKDVDNIKDNENIIFPILDILYKAYEKLGEIPKIDGVILNGGMTKLTLIKDRIKDFFGFEPLSVLDPDMAVASGASVYHYYTYRGYKPTKIINDSIGIEVAGNRVEHLIKEGTVLPYKSPVIDKFTVEYDNTKYIDLPFYLGRRSDTLAPNRKIATRRISFDPPLKTTDKIYLNIEVDEMNMMKITGSVNNSSDNTFTVSVLTSKTEQINNPISTNYELPKKKIKTTKPIGPKLDVANNIKYLTDLFKNHDKTKDPYKKAQLIKSIKQKETAILNAENFKDFIPVLLKKLENANSFGFTRIMQLLGNIISKYDIETEEIIQKAMFYSSPMRFYYLKDFELNTKVRTCIETIGKSENKIAENHLIQVLDNTSNKAIINSSIISLGKVGYTINAIDALKKKLNLSFKTPIFWSIGKLSSKDRDNKIKFEQIKDLKKPLLNSFKTLKNAEEVNYLIYCLGEIFDNRYENNLNEIERSNLIKNILDESKIAKKKLTFNENQKTTYEKFINLTNKMILGTKLTEEENQVLLAIRSKLK